MAAIASRVALSVLWSTTTSSKSVNELASTLATARCAFCARLRVQTSTDKDGFLDPTTHPPSVRAHRTHPKSRMHPIPTGASTHIPRAHDEPLLLPSPVSFRWLAHGSITGAPPSAVENVTMSKADPAIPPSGERPGVSRR